MAAEWFAAREAPNVILAESDSGMALIPAVRREREVGLIGETLFDYRDVLSSGAPEVLAAAWRELAKLGLPLEVTALRGDTVRQRWERFEAAPFCNAPMIRRDRISGGQFAREHRKSAKASRRLARQGVRLTRSPAGEAEAARWIYRHKSEWRGSSANLFIDRQRQNFMLNIRHSGVSHWEIWRYVDINSRILAALVTLDSHSCRHFYTIHHDAGWERFSPGQVLIFDVARESLAEGLDVDFMTGEYPYKNRLANEQVPLYRVRASAEQMSGSEAVAMRPAA